MTMPWLDAGVRRLGLALSGDMLARFERYQQLLETWNRRLNLTAIADSEGIQVRHFLDSLSCLLVMGDVGQASMIDVGAGAGFPGLPLKIANPGLRLTLVDSVVKKADFLAAVVEALDLSEVTVLAARAEDVGRDPAHRERYDWALARSVAYLPVLAEYLLPLVRVGGTALAMKGADRGAELDAAATAIATLGGRPPEVRPVDLPEADRVHLLVTIVKERATPANYPRRAGMPAKRPL